MFTIEHLWIVKRGKGSKIMGAVEHSCWNCANIYKLVRRYFASSVSLNQPALLARFLFACFEEFLFVFYGTHRQSQILYGYDLWKTFPNVQDAPILIYIPLVRYSVNIIHDFCAASDQRNTGGKKQCKTCISWKYRWRILRQNFDFQERVTIMRQEHLINKPLNTASWGDT